MLIIARITLIEQKSGRLPMDVQIPWVLLNIPRNKKSPYDTLERLFVDY